MNLIDLYDKSKYKYIENSKNDICAICHDSIDGICRELICEHTFHASCIDKWLIKNTTCPICRNPMKKEENNRIIINHNNDEINETNINFINNFIHNTINLERILNLAIFCILLNNRYNLKMLIFFYIFYNYGVIKGSLKIINTFINLIN